MNQVVVQTYRMANENVFQCEKDHSFCGVEPTSHLNPKNPETWQQLCLLFIINIFGDVHILYSNFQYSTIIIWLREREKL